MKRQELDLESEVYLIEVNTKRIRKRTRRPEAEVESKRTRKWDPNDLEVGQRERERERDGAIQQMYPVHDLLVCSLPQCQPLAGLQWQGVKMFMLFLLQIARDQCQPVVVLRACSLLAL